MNLPLVVLLVITVILFLVLATISSLRSRVIEVREDRRVVIYRRGRFHRIAGPGWVPLHHRIERIEQEYSIRDEPRSFSIDNLFFHGIPIELTLNFWCHVDLVQAAHGNRDRLAQLTTFSESERRQQVAIKTRDAVVAQLGVLEQKLKLSATASLVDKILPVLPGTENCEQLLEAVADKLETTLPPVGVFFNPDHPITITHIDIPGEMKREFSRGRALDLLRSKAPNTPEEIMLQLVSIPEGAVPPITRETVRIEGEGAAHFQMEGIKEKEGKRQRIPFARPPYAHPNEVSLDSEDAEQPEDVELLTESDLAYLKLIPRRDESQRPAA